MANIVLFRVCALVIGYLIGNFTTGYFIAKANNVDIKSKGSGNVGSTNTLRTMGKKAGAIALIGDILKCIIAALIVFFVFRNFVEVPDGATQWAAMRIYMLYACFGCIVGHDFPVFLKFKGGKGIACTGAMVIILFPHSIIAGFLVFLLVALISKYVSLGSILGTLSYSIFTIVMIYMGYIGFAPEYTKLEATIIIAFIAFLNIFQHRANIKRLLNGTENKLSFKKKEA